MPEPRRPRLTPAMADVRRAVRGALAADPGHDGFVLVGLSGGADSLALAAATAFEAPRVGIRAGAIVVDHGLQAGSASVASRAAEQARGLGLDPVLVVRVEVGATGGPEAAARAARYAAFERALEGTGAGRILLAHTLDDQAETVLLGLTRGSGPRSLSGMDPVSGHVLRPLLGLRRATTRAFCADAGLEPWDDPHNADPAYARVRVRARILPVLERELGPGIAEALARTAEQLREDADALDDLARAEAEELIGEDGSALVLDVDLLAAARSAIRQRVIREAAARLGSILDRGHTLAAARLVTDWHGQKPLTLPGVTVGRRDGALVFSPRTPPSDMSRTDQREGP